MHLHLSGRGRAVARMGACRGSSSLSSWCLCEKFQLAHPIKLAKPTSRASPPPHLYEGETVEAAPVEKQTKRGQWALVCCGYVVVFDDLNEGDMPNSDGSSQLHGICSRCGAGYTVSISDEQP